MALRRRGKTDPRAEAGAGPAATRRGKVRQIFTVIKVTQRRDRRLLPVMLAVLVLPIAVFVLLGLLVGPMYLWIPLGVLLGLALAINVLGRRVQRTAYADIEGRPGAAAGVVDTMRGDWRVTYAVQVNRAQDVVHRVVGRPGIVLIAEGGRGARELLANELRRVRRIAGDTPVRDLVIGTGEDEVPIRKLQVTLMKMPRILRGAQIDAVDRRLKALSAPPVQLPKGPLPKGAPRIPKMPKGGGRR
jgi:hypothetical protein